MTDQFSSFVDFPPTLDSPAQSAFAITSNNSVDLAATTRKLYVGVTGAVRVRTAGYLSYSGERGAGVGTVTGNNVVTFSTVPAGTTLNIRVTRVYRTGTTANSIVGMY